MFLFLRKKENIFRILLCLYFGYLLLGRVIDLNSDSPDYWLDVEEKAMAYNARNKVLFGDWSSGGVNYDATVSSPLPGIISYMSFLILGVHLVSLRLPYALLSVLALLIFYKVLKKEMNSWMALLGTVLFGSSHYILLLSRSALVENLFILLTAASLSLYQDYEEQGKKASLFLFGLFSALTIAVKYSGVYFFVVSAVGALMIVLCRGEGFLERLRSYGIYAAGVALSLTLPVISLFFGAKDGVWETIKFQCGFHIEAGHSFSTNQSGYLSFFVEHLPFISLVALAGLFAMFSLRLRSLTKTDAFVLMWLILGSALAFSCGISYKRLIFLLIAVIYVAVRGGYGMWFYLKSSALTDHGMSPILVRGKGAMPFVWKMIGGCGFVFLVSWAARYVLSGNGVTSFTPAMLLSTFTNKSMFQAGGISLIISLGLLVPPVAGAALRFITTHDLCLAVATLKKWFVAAILFFSIAAMALSIMTNEVRNCEFLFHPENRKHESFELSRDLGQTVKANATIIGSEMALRFLGFENRCKFLFNHDGGNSRGLDPRDLDNSDIARRKDIRYFCIALPTNSILLDQYLFGISKIKRLCPAMTLLKIYRFGDTVLSLFDKYPGLGAEKRF